MARSLQQIIQDAQAKQHDERLKNVQGSYRFDIEGVGSYRLEVDRGRVRVQESSEPADCVLACEPDDFVRIIEGQQNMLTAYMQGRVRIEGDVALAKVFHGFLPSARAAAEEVHP
ncbi:MAG: SCP2 sterol-binding domain-containing protein [Deltaproteobacteria bacterium]|nr:SCP2 sterol-binding domain-containing protein [Deltaproteobacteria bacterium]